MFFHLSGRLARPLFQNSLGHDRKYSSSTVLTFLLSSYFFHPNDFEKCGINDNQIRQCPVNMVGGASFPIQTALAFGMSSLLYVAKHYPDGRTPFILKPKKFVFLLVLT
ncbi:Hypothetical predicted protein [Octopus vulgaris]|uniref:Uncharacterized protein n=1 Tax=Octopus vulgaris TaxID=6645 RepID=A0AA36AZM8_OCTVU|nr:Hypothetical predicted protein [Octopus vulgaris]